MLVCPVGGVICSEGGVVCSEGGVVCSGVVWRSSRWRLARWKGFSWGRVTEGEIREGGRVGMWEAWTRVRGMDMRGVNMGGGRGYLLLCLKYSHANLLTLIYMTQPARPNMFTQSP